MQEALSHCLLGEHQRRGLRAPAPSQPLAAGLGGLAGLPQLQPAAGSSLPDFNLHGEQDPGSAWRQGGGWAGSPSTLLVESPVQRRGLSRSPLLLSAALVAHVWFLGIALRIQQPVPDAVPKACEPAQRQRGLSPTFQQCPGSRAGAAFFSLTQPRSLREEHESTPEQGRRLEKQ